MWQFVKSSCSDLFLHAFLVSRPREELSLLRARQDTSSANPAKASGLACVHFFKGGGSEAAADTCDLYIIFPFFQISPKSALSFPWPWLRWGTTVMLLAPPNQKQLQEKISHAFAAHLTRILIPTLETNTFNKMCKAVNVYFAKTEQRVFLRDAFSAQPQRQAEIIRHPPALLLISSLGKTQT